MATLVLAAAAMAAPALAQNSPLPLPAPVEKELAARASDVTEVTLGKNMLAFAAKFMHDKDDENDNVRQLIEGLDGIYVRDYQFDKEGEYSVDQLDQLRKSFGTPEWQPIVHEHERKSGETTDILMKVVNGENKGMFILSAEPRDLTIVLILGPIRPEDLGKLHGIAGLGALADVEKEAHMKVKEKNKDNTKVKKDGEQ
ncbi:MAG TPA: DUF4252 domain-containing protein [Terracidiphilus sp.]